MNLEKFLRNGSIMTIDQDRLLIGYGPREWLPQPGTFYFPDFFLERENAWCSHEETETISRDELIEQLEKRHTELPPPFWKEPRQEPFFDAFQEVQTGRLKKVVPYVMTTSTDTMTPDRLCHTLLHTLVNGASLHIYGYWGGQGGILGATPELLFRLTGSTLDTAAIAGTAPNDRPADDFLNDPKEREEHRLVIEGITDSLRSFGRLSIGETSLLRLKTLTHLRTPIQLELTQTADTAALVRALHPTPALGAFPKEEGVEWLKAFDARTPRKHYGAPLGCCYGNCISIVVAIRNVQWTPNGLAIGAGCGVIAESKQEREWNEIQLKTEAIFETLGFKTAALPKELSKALSTVG